MSYDLQILGTLRDRETVRVDALLFDDLERVLQVRNGEAREWQLPSSLVQWTGTAEDLATAAMEVVSALVFELQHLRREAQLFHWTVENGVLCLAYLLRVADARELHYSDDPVKRWAPWDTLRDLPLGRKLHASSAS